MQWRLTGRDAELRRLERALTDSAVKGAVIVGPVGVGKSRLATELLAASGKDGVAGLRVTATESAREVPFGALAHVLRLSETPAGDPLVFMEAARVAFAERFGGTRGVLVIDDAHQLDGPSAALVQQLAVTGTAFVVLTVRSGATRPPDAVTRLWTDELADRVELRPLDRGATRRLVEAALDDPLDEPSFEQLWRLTRGNPLFVRELVLAAVERDTLVKTDGVWRFSGPPAISERLLDVVDDRLRHLDPTERGALELLALAEEIGFDVLAGVADASDVARLERHELATSRRSGRRTVVRLAHPLYGEVIRTALPEAERRGVEQRIASALEATGARRADDVLKLALHRLRRGGGGDPAGMTVAAGLALARLDAALAERFARAAVDGGGGFDAHLALGQALTRQNRAEDAEAVLAGADRQAESDAERAEVAMARADNLLFHARQPDRATAVLQSALDAIADEDLNDELSAKQAQCAAISGDFHTAVRAGERVLARPGADARSRLHTLIVSTMGQAMLGQTTAAHRPIELGLELADQLRDEFPLAGDLLSISRLSAAAHAGRLLDAEADARAGYQAALRRGDEPAGVWGSILALSLVMRGLVGEAAAVAREAAGLLTRGDAVGLLPMTLALESVARGHTGDVEGAQEVLAAIPGPAFEADIRVRIHGERARVWMEAASGDTAGAATVAAEAGRWAVEHTHLVWGAQLLHDAARLGHPEGVVDDLRAATAACDGDLVSGYADHAAALADADAVVLERVSRRFDRMGATLAAAEAAHQSAELRQLEDDPSWRRLAARSAELAAACPGARTPALSFPPVRLTRREREIGLLAAAGHSSPEIAERLVVSVRTVDNHLGVVYRKLGVDGRHELAEILGTAPGSE